MLSMMISGPKQPGNDIDVYQSPLIDDLRMLWEEGVDVLDAYSGEQFNMRAMLFCTINDFPAYGNLSGYTVKGHSACPICEKETSFQQLKNGKKTVYLRHRKFLERYHPYCFKVILYFMGFYYILYTKNINCYKRKFIFYMILCVFFSL
jgi:hypothetical protein